MRIEYSRNQGEYAYVFHKDEQRMIARCLKPEIKRIEKKIKAIEDDPNNEGQVTYADAIRELQGDIDFINEIQEHFGK